MAITKEQANQIASAYQSGVDPQTLAAQYGLTQRDVDTYFPGFDTTGLNLPSGSPTLLPSSAPAPIATSFTQQSGSRLTPGQAQQLYNAYQQGDMTNVQNLVNTYGVKAEDIQAYFPGFDTSTLAGQGINLVGTQQPNLNTTFNMADYLSKVNDMYSKSAQASSSANLQGAQTATAANRVNQITPFGNVSYTQSGIDSQGNPIWTATQTLPKGLEGAYQGILGQVSNQYQNQFKPQLPSVGINPSETYYDAVMRRLEPVQARQRKSLEVDLANQGIMPNSEAYNRAKEQLSQQQNDQLTSAVVGGFNTGLAANQNAFNQGLTSYQLPMATLNQFRTGSQPSYVTPSQQATVAGPDYLNAYTASQNYNLGLQNANAASNAGLTSGLFGLGSAALLNPTGVSQAYGALSSGLNKLFG